MAANPVSPKSVRSSGWYTAVVAAGIFLSRIAGFIRERCFTHYLGNSDAAGAFRAALRVPNLLQNLFGEGALSASFVPVYARLLAEGRDADARILARTVATVLLFVVGVLAVLGSFASPWLVAVLAPGFEAEEKMLAETLVTILFPATALLTASAWCLGVLNSHRRFFLSYAAPVVWNAAIVVAQLRFGGVQTGNELVRTIAWSVVVGSALQFFVQLPSAWKLVGGLVPTMRLEQDSVRRVLKNFAPALVTRGVAQFNAYIDQVLSSFLGAAAVAAIAYGQTLLLLPISLFGLAIATAELPELSSTLGDDATRRAAIGDRVLRARRRLWFLVLPSFVAYVGIGDVVVATLFQTGRFGLSEVREVQLIVAAGAFTLLPATTARLYSSVFWAVGNVALPARVAVARVLAAGALGASTIFFLAPRLNATPMQSAALLVAASSLAAGFEYLVLRVLLRRTLGLIPLPMRFVVDLCFACAIALAVTVGARKIPQLSLLGPFVRGLLLLGTFGGVYGAATYLLRIEEARALGNSVLRRFRR